MRTCHRPNRLKAFGLVDSLVGLFLLLTLTGLLSSGFSTLTVIDQRQAARIEALLSGVDGDQYGPRF